MKRIVLTAVAVLISALTVCAQTESPVVSMPASAGSHKHHHGKQHNRQKSEHSHHHHNQH
jgi:Ni/Co efflux regulator RcnB